MQRSILLTLAGGVAVVILMVLLDGREDAEQPPLVVPRPGGEQRAISGQPQRHEQQHSDHRREDVAGDLVAEAGGIKLRLSRANPPLRVALCNSDGERLAGTETLSDKLGEVLWPGLPDGNYRWELLTAAPIAITSSEDRGPRPIRGAPLSARGTRLSDLHSVRAGKLTIIDIRLSGLSISGVVNAMGSIATVSTHRRAVVGGLGHWRLVANTVCNSSGAFSLRDAAPGDYRLTARWLTGPNECWFATRHFTVENSSVDLSVIDALPGVLRGSVQTRQGAATRTIVSGLGTMLVSDSDGRRDRSLWVQERVTISLDKPFALHGVTDGVYDVSLRPQGQIEHRSNGVAVAVSAPPLDVKVKTQRGPVTLYLELEDRRDFRIHLQAPCHLAEVRYLLLGSAGDTGRQTQGGNEAAFSLKPGDYAEVYVVGVDQDGGSWVGAERLEPVTAIALFRGVKARGQIAPGVIGTGEVHLTVAGAKQTPLWSATADSSGNFILDGLCPDWNVKSLQGFSVEASMSHATMMLMLSK